MGLLRYIAHGFGFTVGARVAQDALAALDEETKPEPQLSPREQMKLDKAKAKAEARERKRREADVEAQLRALKKKAKT